MERNNRLTEHTFRSVLIVNIMSMVSAIACVMIDAIVTGQFLGSNAVASVGLIQPVVMICNLVGPLFGPGMGIVCTRYMGMAKLDRVKQVFSVVITTLICIAVFMALVLFTAAPVLASALGGRTGDPEVVEMITAYLRGFSPGIPFFLMCMSLSGLMMIDNDRKLGVTAVICVLIADVTFDLLNVLVFHGGLFGMAVATSLSNVVGVTVLLTHFFKKNTVLRYTFRGLHITDLKEVVFSGVPNAVSSGSMALRNLVFNTFILYIATKHEVSALSITNSSFSIIMAVCLAFTTTTSTVTSLFYGEEDRHGITTALKLAMKTILVVFGVITVLVLIFANVISGFFLKSDSVQELTQAATFTRFMVVEYFLMCLSYTICGAYQGAKRLKFSYLLVPLREAVFPILSVLIMGSIFGLQGVGYGFVLAGALELICTLGVSMVKNKKFSLRAEDILMLEEDFGSAPENTFEASAQNMDDVINVSQQVMDFYKSKNVDGKTAYMVSLFIEELAGNTIQHGVAEENSEKNVDIRVIYAEDKQTIRIRDNAKPFDPVEWFHRLNPEDKASGIGIRMVIGLAKDVRYIPAMGLNNMMLVI